MILGSPEKCLTKDHLEKNLPHLGEQQSHVQAQGKV